MRSDIPTVVSVSVALLVATHMIGLAQMIGLSRALDVPLWMPYSGLALLYSPLIFLIVMMLRGSQWARTAYTALGVLGLVSTARCVRELDTLGWLIVAAKLAALVLLYVPASNAWFAGQGIAADSARKTT